MAWGSFFTVKNDSQNNIHLVVNEEFLLCPCNNIFYISLIGSEWSDFVLIPFGKDDYYDNDERWNPQINFIEDSLINIMDLESYESMDVDWPKDEALVKKFKDIQADPGKLSSAQVEYWQLAGRTLLNRIIIN